MIIQRKQHDQKALFAIGYDALLYASSNIPHLICPSNRRISRPSCAAWSMIAVSCIAVAWSLIAAHHFIVVAWSLITAHNHLLWHGLWLPRITSSSWPGLWSPRIIPYLLPGLWLHSYPFVKSTQSSNAFPPSSLQAPTFSQYRSLWYRLTSHLFD